MVLTLLVPALGLYGMLVVGYAIHVATKQPDTPSLTARTDMPPKVAVRDPGRYFHLQPDVTAHETNAVAWDAAEPTRCALPAWSAGPEAQAAFFNTAIACVDGYAGAVAAQWVDDRFIRTVDVQLIESPVGIRECGTPTFAEIEQMALDEMNGVPIETKEFENGAFYCFDERRMVFARGNWQQAGSGKQFVNYDGSSSSAAQAVQVVAHEYGHYLQDVFELNHYLSDTAMDTKRMEAQAQCYSGAVVARLFPAYREDVLALQWAEGDPKHPGDHNNREMLRVGMSSDTLGECNTWLMSDADVE
ncbi:hypothetical protein HCA44_19655 [Rhodococcus sp. HNM0569]|nr:hypothetical protein [Rhodococcus sp. HNM0569]